MANQIDDEVRRFVIEGQDTAHTLLEGHREVLDKLAAALLERETLDAEEVDAIVVGRELPVRERVVIPTYSDRDKAAKDKRRAAVSSAHRKPAPST